MSWGLRRPNVRGLGEAFSDRGLELATIERNLHRNKGWGVVGIQPQKSYH